MQIARPLADWDEFDAGVEIGNLCAASQRNRGL